jgi:diguanylate cyclase (GGDEF)-like protein
VPAFVRTLRFKVSVALLIAAALCAFAAGNFSGRELSASYRDGAERLLAAGAKSFASGFSPEELRSPSRLEAELAVLRRQDPNLNGAVVVRPGPDGPVAVARSGPRPPSRADLVDARRVLAAGAPVSAERETDSTHAATRTQALGRGSRPGAALWLSYDLAPSDRAVKSRDLRIFGVLLVLLLAFTAFTAWLLGRSIFRPLDLLRFASRRIAEGRLETRLRWDRQDELGVLAKDFDGMAAELEENHGRLEDLALRDPLTGLANHRQFQEGLHAEVERASRDGSQVALILIDIDRFKRVNDAWGHPAGDRVLSQAGRNLSEAINGSGLTARLGGDEFAILLTDANPTKALAICEAGRAAVGSVESADAEITCSAGVAIFPDDASSADGLGQLADGALYWAKRSGRNLARRYDPEHVLVVTSEQRAEFAELLESPDAITPVFQPIVALETGEVLAYEALARFDDGKSPRPPTWWFAQAHRFGLGAKLEAEAIRAALEAPDRPIGLSLSVNVSPSALGSPEVQAVLPEQLEKMIFEITEQERIIHPHELQETLRPLRERGARVAVDDAGAGYAGLQQIMRMNADFIKLDRALIQNAHLDQAKTALIGSLVDFAASTGAEVCAEGIETLDELRALVGLGVSCGQGYVLARPAPPWTGVNPDAAALCRSLSREAKDPYSRRVPGVSHRRRSHTG